MNKVNPLRTIVIGVGLKDRPFEELKRNLFELEELVVSAGFEVVGSMVQVLNHFQPATLMGKGKVMEVMALAEEVEAGLIVVDHHLSGAQCRNLAQAINVKVIDRTQIILEIFAQRARSYEGKLQVELAQMLDQLPRMVGAWLGSLSRQGGGIGTRGPGETALELDRRQIFERIRQIRKKLESVRSHRGQHRSARRKRQLPSFALIGYTNSGKSTLLNKLTGSHVLEKDQFFATLDPTTRKLDLPGCGPAILTDTVGFIRDLPPHLIDAFKATLEESDSADILLHVIDLADPNVENKIKTVESLIKEFSWDAKPILHVYNKVDVAPLERHFQAKGFPRVLISAAQGKGLDKLKEAMTEAVQGLVQEVELFFPKDQEHKLFELGRVSYVSRMEPATSGTICFVRLNPSQLGHWHEFLVKAPRLKN